MNEDFGPGEIWNSAMMAIPPIELPVPGLELLRTEVREGFRFLESLWTKWGSGETPSSRQE